MREEANQRRNNVPRYMDLHAKCSTVFHRPGPEIGILSQSSKGTLEPAGQVGTSQAPAKTSASRIGSLTRENWTEIVDSRKPVKPDYSSSLVALCLMHYK